MARDLDLNINGDARRARRALEDVATGSARAARVSDQLSRSFNHLENEANDAQRQLDHLNDELSRNGPSAELSAELARVQSQLSDIANERGVAENLRAQFRRSTAAAAQLDHQLASTRRELDRLNDEYSQGGDPNVLRRIQEQQRELQRLNSIRRRIQDEDENNQARLARIAEEARRAQTRRDEQTRRDNENGSLLGRVRRLGNNAGNSLQGAPVPPTALAVGGAIGAAAAVPLLAAIGGALTGAVGAGIAGAGIAGAVMGDPERFKSEWASATDSIKTEFLDATAIFTGPTLEAIRSVGPLVESWNIGATFADAAKYVGPLVDGIESFASGVVRGVAAMVNKGEPAVEALSSGLAELGNAAGDAFESIAGGADGGGEALRDIIFATAEAIRLFGDLTGAAEKSYGYIHDHPVDAALATGGLSLAITLLDQFSDKTEHVGVVLDATASSTSKLVSVQEALAKAAKDASDAISSQLGILLDVGAANDAATKSYQDLLGGLKETGYVLTGNSEKALANRDALRGTVDAWEAQRDAAIAAGAGSTEATNAANAALLGHLEDLRRVLVAHHANTSQVDEYIDAVKRASGLVLTTIFRNVYQNEGTPFERQKTGHSRDIDQHAKGGTVTGTGPMLVGELGPEVVWGNQGQFVSTAAQTQRLASAMSRGGAGGGGGTGGPPVVRVIVEDTSGRVLRDTLVTTASNHGQTLAQYLGV